MAVNMLGFRRNVFGLLVGQVSRLGLQAAYFVVLARMLGASGYGAFAAALALVALVTPFSSLGANTLMLKNVARNHEAASTEWIRALVYTLIGGIALSLVLTALTDLIAPAELSRVAIFQIAFAELIGMKLVELVGALWQGVGKSRPLIILPPLVNLLRLAAALALFTLHGQSSLEEWAPIYILVTLPLGVFVAAHTTKKLGFGSGDLRLRGREIREGLLYSVALSSQNIYNDIDKAMLGRLNSVAAAGLYSAGYRIVDMAYAPIRSISAAAYPLFFREGERGLLSALKLTRKLAPIVLILGAVAGAGAAWLAPLAPILLGSEYGGAVDVIRLLSPLVFLRGLSFLAADTLTGCGKQGIRTVVQISVAVVNVGLNFALIPLLGISGAIIVTLVCEAVLAAALWACIAYSVRLLRKDEQHSVVGMSDDIVESQSLSQSLTKD